MGSDREVNNSESGYRYGFNGKEKDQDNEFGNLTHYDYDARIYNPSIGKFLSVDPLFDAPLNGGTGPYTFVWNSPLKFIDPTGMHGESVDGDYYDSKGKHLGSDGKEDDKVYSASSVKKDSKGLVASAENATDLGVTHTEFRKQSSTVYAESSAYKLNTVTTDLENEMFAIASVHQKNSLAYGADAPKAKEYLALTPQEVNKSKFKTTANAAVINALTGGFDYSYGATMWDGKEQALFDKKDDRKSDGKWELHMNTMGWSISDSHYKLWKDNIGPTFKAPQKKVSPANLGNYKNKGKIRLQSAAVYGETIFWKVK